MVSLTIRFLFEVKKGVSGTLDWKTLTAAKPAMLVVFPIALLWLLAAPSPAKADYTHTYIEVINDLDRTILVEVQQYDTYYKETDYRSEQLEPGESYVFYFQPTAWLWWEGTYEYTVKASQAEVELVLTNTWSVAAEVVNFAKYTPDRSTYSAHVTFSNNLFLRGSAHATIHILR